MFLVSPLPSWPIYRDCSLKRLLKFSGALTENEVLHYRFELSDIGISVDAMITPRSGDDLRIEDESYSLDDSIPSKNSTKLDI